MEDWALIRRLVADGVPQRQVAKDLGIARATVARAVASAGPPKYQRATGPNAFTAYEPAVRALLAEHPDLPATVLAERIAWTGSITWFREHVAPLRAAYRRPDPADRLVHAPGDVVQCDLWFPAVRIPTGVVTDTSTGGQARTAIYPVLVMVAAHSRFITAVMLPSRTTADLLCGMWTLINLFGAVPRRLLWDNEAGIGRRGRLADGVGAFCGTLGTKLVQARPYDPETKGVVERANQYLETSFLPGRVFTDAADFTAQVQSWLTGANQRTVRALRARPVDLLAADRAGMLALPPAAPTVGFRDTTRLGRDYYVRACGNDYSVDPAAIGQLVDVTADLDTVTITGTAAMAGVVLGRHHRCWDSAATITDPTHVVTAARLRRALLTPPASTSGALLRDLGDYDRAFGINPDDLRPAHPDGIDGIDGKVA